MRKLSIYLTLLALIGCTTSSVEKTKPDQAKFFLKAGDECEQTRYEALWLSDRIVAKQRWFKADYKSYSSDLESLVGELSGQLRYNAMFLRTEPQDASRWSFYVPNSSPRNHIHNLFRSISREDNALMEGAQRRVWIDSKYRTLEFTEADLEKICPDCVASKDHFKAAIVAKFPNGKVDLWVINHAGLLKHVADGCGNASAN